MSSLECTCGRPFSDENALRAHRKHRAPNICPHCNKCHRTRKQLLKHNPPLATCSQNPVKDMQWRCNDCSAVYDNRAAANRHIQNTGHATEFRCCDCNRNFASEKDLINHLENKVHRKPVAKPKKRKTEPQTSWCKDCDRTFKDKKALKQHLDSVIHRPISDLGCIAGKICGVECKARFRNPSAMVAHMESGACRSGMDRQKLNRLILVQDGDHLITSSSGIFEASGSVWASLENEPDSSSCSGIMTPSTDSDEGVMLTPSSSQVDLMSLVSRKLTESEYAELPAAGVYLCPLCPGSKRRFKGRKSLEQHMHSAAHTPKMFHCPSILFQGKPGKSGSGMKQFSTVSGLVAHIESSACRGGNAGLRTVMGYMEGRLEDMGISFKLLSL